MEGCLERGGPLSFGVSQPAAAEDYGHAVRIVGYPERMSIGHPLQEEQG
jgi:hypothetical protein